MDIERINPSEKWSDVTVFNKMAHFVEVADDESADMLGQVEQVFAQAEASLASVNSDKSHLF